MTNPQDELDFFEKTLPVTKMQERIRAAQANEQPKTEEENNND